MFSKEQDAHWCGTLSKVERARLQCDARDRIHGSTEGSPRNVDQSLATGSSAPDRRGHGHSSQPFDGNDMDYYADDLAGLLDHLDVTNAVLAGFRPAAAKRRVTLAGPARNAWPKPA
jgi:hypothetical protein